MWKDSRIAGQIVAELTSADIPATLTVLQYEGIEITDLRIKDELTIILSIHKSEWNHLCKLCKKRGEKIEALSHRGILSHFEGVKKRPILIAGLTLLLLLSLWTPGRIFFVRVEGNTTIESAQIIETASYFGIHFGASRVAVRSEKVKNAILESMPSIAWAGVNTYGCTAVITVRERTTTSDNTVSEGVSSIVAVADAIVRNMTVLRGKGLCKVGEAVKEGQVLISGYTDCGLMIQAQMAKGEVFGETIRAMTAISPREYAFRTQQTGVKQKLSLIIGKKRINFTNSSGISGTGCAKIYEEKYVSLPGGFVLPFAIAIEQWISYDTELCEYGNAELLLRDYVKYSIPLKMVGGKILAAEETIKAYDGVFLLSGNYHCYEMIGITKIEENMPHYVKND